MLNYDLVNNLFGSLVGLAKACESHPMTDAGTKLIIESLALIKEIDSKEKAMREAASLIGKKREVQEEKYNIVPNCRTCASPCGNTSDYDMGTLWEAEESVREAKLQLIDGLCEMASGGLSEEKIYGLYRGIATASFDYSAEEIAEITREILEG